MGVAKAIGPSQQHNGFLPKTLAIACLAMFGAAINARAEAGDGFQVQASINMTHDDNLFFLPDPSVVPPGAPHTGSTWMETETADLSFNKIYGLQAVHADVSANRYTFNSLHYLDYNAVNFDANWQWHLTNRFSGTIDVYRRKTFDGYQDFHGYSTPNLSIHSGETFQFDWNSIGPWHIVGGVIHANVSSPSRFTQVGTFSQTDFQLGAGYVSRLGNSVTFQVRDSLGTFSRDLDFFDALDNGYRQREAEVLTHWNLGAWTTVNTRIGYVDRRYDHFDQRNYQGWVGQVELDWQTSARTAIKAVASRNVVAFQSGDSSYYWVEQLSAGPTWNITSKLKLAATGNVSWRTFRGALGGAPNTGARTNRSVGGRVELDYAPTRYSSIGVFATWSQQTANLVESAYKDRTFGINASLTF